MSGFGNDLRYEGFWRERKTHPSALPWPEPTFPSLDEKDKMFVANFVVRLTGLEALARRLELHGSSPCRLCGNKTNGSREFCANGWVWPEGYKHYILDHEVLPSTEFIQMVQAEDSFISALNDWVGSLLSRLRNLGCDSEELLDHVVRLMVRFFVPRKHIFLPTPSYDPTSGVALHWEATFPVSKIRVSADVFLSSGDSAMFTVKRDAEEFSGNLEDDGPVFLGTVNTIEGIMMSELPL